MNDFEIFKVLFIDYGNTQTVNVNELRLLPEELMKKPPQAMECVLAEIRPSLVVNPRAIWSDKANAEFITHTKDCELFAKVRN